MKENLILRKNWIWDVLEIDWTDMYLLQDHKEINLPVTVAIPLYYKYKLRQFLKTLRERSPSLIHHAKTEEVLAKLGKY